ncbi:hypothetical protein ACFXKS_23665 [Streptomyces scopuliridis]|uniref:hypothetical protein n=1 Tax=Streptomyces scopuliridis TaxID=452529 RepID=UPI00369B30A9
MPAMLIDEPLGIACVFSNGRRAEFSLDGLLNPRLARDLVCGLAELVHPHGTVDAAGSVMHYVSSSRHMVRTLASRGFTGGVGQLSRGMLAEYWMGTSMGRERRTLALEMAYRPGGVLATKIHLKHIVVATTEGYSSRPGGAQAELLAEVNKLEGDRNLDLVLTEFRNYQRGILPSGPGARSPTEFFASIDAKLEPMTAPAPKTQRSDRDVLNLLAKRARTLHLGPVNYCWFTDPSRALCLKLAGTPTADRPLIWMCDSARCPQATHHSCHRPVWAERATRTETFIGQLGATRKTERTRLQGDYDRALRVVAEIDAASTTVSEELA